MTNAHTSTLLFAAISALALADARAAPKRELERPATYEIRIDAARIPMPDGFALSADL